MVGTLLHTYANWRTGGHRLSFEDLRDLWRKEQELSDYHRQKIEEAKTYTKNEKVVSADPDAPEQSRIEAEEVLPGYMLKLTDGYEYRTYSFELVETIRKVALVSGG